MFGFAHGGQEIIWMYNLRVKKCDINFLFEADIKEGFHKEFQIVYFVTFGVVDQKVILLGLFLYTYNLLTDCAQLSRIMPHSTEGI